MEHPASPHRKLPIRVTAFDLFMVILGGFGISFAIFFLGVVLQGNLLKASLSGMSSGEEEVVVAFSNIMSWWLWWLIVSIGGLFFSWVLLKMKSEK